MNVLLITLGAQCNPEAIRFWEAHLGDRGALLVLRICGTEQPKIPKARTHDLEQVLFYTEYRRWPKKILEISFRNAQRATLVAPKLNWPYSLLLWNAVLRFHWRGLVWDILSFDPDVIDLRWIPESATLKKKLSREMQKITILSDAEAFNMNKVNDSWRKYDPQLKVSVVLPVYNGAKYLTESIRSCLDQTHRNLQLVVVDDCSTDKTPEIIKEFAELDHRITSIRNKTNLHLPGALNVGFRHSTGDLLSWTSHDNCYAPDAIETLVRQLCSVPNVGLVYSAFRHIDERGRVDPRIVYLPHPSLLPVVNSVGPCFLYRRAVYDAIGDYDEKVEYQEDYDYWLRVSKRFRLMRLHIPLYYYRRNPESMTARRREHPEIIRPVKIS